MKIVFATTCKNRGAHLALTLPQNMYDNPRSTFVVLDYGSDEDLSPIFEPLRCERLAVYRTEQPHFRMAHAKNMAHRLALLEGADVIVNVDADNYLHEGFEDWVERAMQPGNFIWARGDGDEWHVLRGVNGRIGVTRAAFLKTGGYDEKFEA